MTYTAYKIMLNICSKQFFHELNMSKDKIGYVNLYVCYEASKISGWDDLKFDNFTGVISFQTVVAVGPYLR